MTLKEQLNVDLEETFFNTDEFDEGVIYTDSSGIPHEGKAVIEFDGYSMNDWAGGEALVAEIILAKSFAGNIRPHETITDSEGRVWIVKTVKSLDSSAIVVYAHTDLKVKA